MLVVDECSQVNVSLWNAVGRLQRRGDRDPALGVHFLLCGDFNQFGAIEDEWRGTKVPGHRLESTGFLRELCRHRLTLTKNQRSDARLFDWYASLIPGGARHHDLPGAVREARATFRPSGEAPRYTLCLSHDTRKRENEEANEREAARHDAKVRIEGEGTHQ